MPEVLRFRQRSTGGWRARSWAVFALGFALASAALGAATKDTTTSSLPVASPESAGMSSERLARLRAAMHRYVDQQQVAGYVALVARQGKVVHHESYGARSVADQTPMQNDTIFRIASMTKPIASVALMMLYEEGRFQLRDPIHRFLPYFKDPKVAVAPAENETFAEQYKLVDAARPITFQHVITHTAGLANTSRGPTKPQSDALRAALKPETTVGDMLQELAKLPLNFHPGDRWEYGPGTDVVGLLVEVLSGQSLEDFLDQRIFGPLHMPDTHFFLPEHKLPRFAALYKPDEGGRIALSEAPTRDSRYLRQPQVYFSGAGGLVSTAADYWRFHQMMLDGGVLDGARILSPKTVELMTVNHIGDLETWLRGPGYGFGLGYSVVTDLGRSGISGSLGTYAWGGAFGTTFWVDPKERLIGILMIQIRPYDHINIRQDMQTLTYQAILE